MKETPPASEVELDLLETQVDEWLRTFLDVNELCVAVDRGEKGERRWFVRLKGEDKDFTTVWLRLGQRALHVESYVMPAPEENHERFFEHLLRRNRKTHGLAFCIGDEDAVFLVGQLPLSSLDEANLDRMIGSTYAYVEQFFRPALRIGFASRFKDSR